MLFGFTALSDFFDQESLIKFQKMTIQQRILLNIMAVIYIPVALYKLLSVRENSNSFNHFGNLSGIKNLAFSRDIKVSDLKKACSKHKCSLNDYITSILSISAKQYMQTHGDIDPQKLIITLPVNLRNDLPQTEKEVKIFNALTAVTFALPLFSEFNRALSTLNIFFNKMKSSCEF